MLFAIAGGAFLAERRERRETEHYAQPMWASNTTRNECFRSWDAETPLERLNGMADIRSSFPRLYRYFTHWGFSFYAVQYIPTRIPG